jgi:hypothetical protein
MSSGLDLGPNVDDEDIVNASCKKKIFPQIDGERPGGGQLHRPNRLKQTLINNDDRADSLATICHQGNNTPEIPGHLGGILDGFLPAIEDKLERAAVEAPAFSGISSNDEETSALAPNEGRVICENGRPGDGFYAVPLENRVQASGDGGLSRAWKAYKFDEPDGRRSV